MHSSDELKNLTKLRDNKTSPQTAIVHFWGLFRDGSKLALLLMGTGGWGGVGWGVGQEPSPNVGADLPEIPPVELTNL